MPTVYRNRRQVRQEDPELYQHRNRGEGEHRKMLQFIVRKTTFYLLVELPAKSVNHYRVVVSITVFG